MSLSHSRGGKKRQRWREANTQHRGEENVPHQTLGKHFSTGVGNNLGNNLGPQATQRVLGSCYELGQHPPCPCNSLPNLPMWDGTMGRRGAGMGVGRLAWALMAAVAGRSHRAAPAWALGPAFSLPPPLIVAEASGSKVGAAGTLTPLAGQVEDWSLPAWAPKRGWSWSP